MTVHGCKGLEFDTVLVVGCHNGSFPTASSVEEGRQEEERRLLYVGASR